VVVEVFPARDIPDAAALAAGYVSLCDRIIGPDPEVEPDLTEVDEPRVTVTR